MGEGGWIWIYFLSVFVSDILLYSTRDCKCTLCCCSVTPLIFPLDIWHTLKTSGAIFQLVSYIPAHEWKPGHIFFKFQANLKKHEKVSLSPILRCSFNYMYMPEVQYIPALFFYLVVYFHCILADRIQNKWNGARLCNCWVWHLFITSADLVPYWDWLGTSTQRGRNINFHYSKATCLEVCLSLMTCLACVVVRKAAVNTLPPRSTIAPLILKQTCSISH